MNANFMGLFMLWTIFFPLLNPSRIQAQNFTPWISYPTPLRTIYVSPTGTGEGTQASPLNLVTALSTAKPGDEILMLPGTYIGDFRATIHGTANARIILKSATENRTTIDGGVYLDGDYWSLINVEITNPDGLGERYGVNVHAAHVHIINNTIHTICDSNGLGAWKAGPGQIYYGNILYNNGCNPTMLDDGSRLRHPHTIYSQNDGATEGEKYFKHNLIFAPGCTDNCFTLHMYGSSAAFLNGYKFDNNLIAGHSQQARVLFGGNIASFNNTFDNNLWYNASIMNGYTRPGVATFRNNTMFKGSFRQEHFWTSDSTRPHPWTVTGNKFVNIRYYLTTERIVNGIVEKGVAPLSTDDVWDNNQYLGTWQASDMHANNVRVGFLSPWSRWLSFTAESGKAFDANTTTGPVPATPDITYWTNEYDPKKIYVTVFNYASQPSVTLNVSGNAIVYNARDQWGAPVAQGNGSIQVPMTSDFGSFVVVIDNPSSTPAPKPGDANGDNVVDGKDYVRWLNFYQRASSAGAAEGDFNRDGTVDGKDYVVWLNNYN